jgi:hypothetical protein
MGLPAGRIPAFGGASTWAEAQAYATLTNPIRRNSFALFSFRYQNLYEHNGARDRN